MAVNQIFMRCRQKSFQRVFTLPKHFLRRFTNEIKREIAIKS